MSFCYLLPECFGALPGIAGHRILHDQSHLAAVSDRPAELLGAVCGGLRIVCHTGALDPLITVPGIKRHDRDPVPDRQVELDCRCIFINAGNGDHVRIP